MASVIDWVNGHTQFHQPLLSNWKRRIRTLEKFFQQISFRHIYREPNQIAHILSKRGVAKQPSVIFFAVFVQGTLSNIGSINIIQDLSVVFFVFIVVFVGFKNQFFVTTNYILNSFLLIDWFYVRSCKKNCWKYVDIP